MKRRSKPTSFFHRICASLFVLVLTLSIALLFDNCSNRAEGEHASDEVPQAKAGLQEEGHGPITLVLHGGAGTIKKENMSPELEEDYKQEMKKALIAGYTVLEEGGSSVKAVTTTLQLLEASPLFNAGIGAVFTNEGENELDASIMDGATGLAGAVAGVTTVKSPILAAEAVMQHSPHVMMVGKGAEVFAKEQGLEMVDKGYFHTERRFQQLQKIKKAEEEGQKMGYLDRHHPNRKFGTVGAVALDKNGNIAAGTSTGGMTNKKFGRVGDSPIIGAGTYADNMTCGVSATGHGEYFIRSVVAYDIAATMSYKSMSLEDAAHEVIMKKLVEKQGTGGIIALDRKGNIAMPFNTSGMYRGYIQEKDLPKVFIYKE